LLPNIATKPWSNEYQPRSSILTHLVEDYRSTRRKGADIAIRFAACGSRKFN
jgi:hypothetical protein